MPVPGFDLLFTADSFNDVAEFFIINQFMAVISGCERSALWCSMFRYSSFKVVGYAYIYSCVVRVRHYIDIIFSHYIQFLRLPRRFAPRNDMRNVYIGKVLEHYPHTLEVPRL